MGMEVKSLKIETKEDLNKLMKQIEIDSESAKEFLNKYKEQTQIQYRTRLKRYLAYRIAERNTEIDFDDIKREAKQDWNKGKRERDFVPEKHISEFQKFMEDIGFASNTIANCETTMRAFYKFHQLPLNTDRFQKTERINENSFKRISKKEVSKLYNSTTSWRNKALLLFMYQTGQSVTQICNLTYGDVKKELEQGKEPLMIQYHGRKGNANEYVTFLGSDGIHALKKYLEERETKLSRNIKADEPLFASRQDYKSDLDPSTVSSMVKYLAKKSGLVDEEDLDGNLNPYRPHAFRHNFKSQLATKCSNFVIEYMMGHEIGVEKDYFLADFDGKEGLRKYYAKNMEPELSIQATSIEKKAIVSSDIDELITEFEEEEIMEIISPKLEKQKQYFKDKWTEEREKRKSLEDRIKEQEQKIEETRGKWKEIAEKGIEKYYNYWKMNKRIVRKLLAEIGEIEAEDIETGEKVTLELELEEGELKGEKK